MSTLQKAQEYARSLGHHGQVKFLRRWHMGDVFTIASPQGEDAGEPLVVVIEQSGTVNIRQLSEIR